MEVNELFSSIGIPGLILILIIALIIFGPKKLPELGKATGQTLREFKKSTNDLISDDEPQSEEQKAENVQKAERVDEEDQGKSEAK